MDEDQLRQSLEDSPILRLVSLAGHVVAQRFRRVVGGQSGLTAGGAAVLGVLGWGVGRGVEQGVPGRATHADLARRCLIAPGTLTGIVDTLERAGHLRRERDDADRRVVWLVITESGRARVSEIGTQIADAYARTLHSLDPAREQAVRGFLVQLIVESHDAE